LKEYNPNENTPLVEYGPRGAFSKVPFEKAVDMGKSPVLTDFSKPFCWPYIPRLSFEKT
jgi:hypothetical protein